MGGAADPAPEPPVFGAWLLARRQAGGLSRKALAEQVSCSPETIRAIERGERRPSRTLAKTLLDQFQAPKAERAALLATLARRRPPRTVTPAADSTPAPAAEPVAASDPPVAAPTPPPPPLPSIQVDSPSWSQEEVLAHIEALFAAQQRALEQILTDRLRAERQASQASQKRWLARALSEERRLVQREHREWEQYRDLQRRGRRAAWIYGGQVVIMGFALGVAPQPAMVLTVAFMLAVSLGLTGRPWIELQILEGTPWVPALLTLTFWGLLGIGLVAVFVIQWRTAAGL